MRYPVDLRSAFVRVTFHNRNGAFAQITSAEDFSWIDLTDNDEDLDIIIENLRNEELAFEVIAFGGSNLKFLDEGFVQPLPPRQSVSLKAVLYDNYVVPSRGKLELPVYKVITQLPERSSDDQPSGVVKSIAEPFLTYRVWLYQSNVGSVPVDLPFARKG